MAKLEGVERANALSVFAQVDAIHRIEDMEPTELQKQLRQAILDGVVTSAQAAKEMSAYAAANGSLKGFIASRTWYNRAAS